MKCNLCDSEAIAIFLFTEGCYCDRTPLQPLCLHHSFKFGPNDGGAMILVKNLSEDNKFTLEWNNNNH